MTRPQPQSILSACAQAFGVTVDDILSRNTTVSRTADVCLARCAVAYVMREFGYVLTEAGKVLHRDHTTVKDLVYKLIAKMVFDDELEAKVFGLRDVLMASARDQIPISKSDGVMMAKFNRMRQIQRSAENGYQDIPGVDKSAILALRKKDWSLRRICKRLSLPPSVVAPIIGLPETARYE